MRQVCVLSMLCLLFCVNVVFAAESATKEECVAMCKKAAQMYKEQGEAATLKAINDPHGPFIWKGDYVFALDVEKKCIVAHPIKPKLIGKKVVGLKDINGKMFFAEFVTVAKEKGQGWVDYMWPKPGEKKPSHKKTFIYLVPGTTVAMAAGIYD